MIPLIALLVGAILGLVFQPTVPAALAPYLPVSYTHLTLPTKA